MVALFVVWLEMTSCLTRDALVRDTTVISSKTFACGLPTAIDQPPNETPRCDLTAECTCTRKAVCSCWENEQVHHAMFTCLLRCNLPCAVSWMTLLVQPFTHIILIPASDFPKETTKTRLSHVDKFKPITIQDSMSNKIAAASSRDVQHVTAGGRKVLDMAKISGVEYLVWVS